MKRTRRAAVPDQHDPRQTRPVAGSFVVRDALPDDVSAIAEVYAYYVIETVITFENSIYLAPDRAGHGHGRSLLDELLLRAAAAGAREVIAVIADTGDPASVALHRSAGFTDAGRLRRVGFKHGRWIDTVLLQHTLETVD